MMLHQEHQCFPSPNRRRLVYAEKAGTMSAFVREEKAESGSRGAAGGFLDRTGAQCTGSSLAVTEFG